MKLISLIKLDEHDRLGMHSELWDTGRVIIADESTKPRKCSRLWKPEEVDIVLMKENMRF